VGNPSGTRKIEIFNLGHTAQWLAAQPSPAHPLASPSPHNDSTQPYPPQHTIVNRHPLRGPIHRACASTRPQLPSPLSPSPQPSGGAARRASYRRSAPGPQRLLLLLTMSASTEDRNSELYRGIFVLPVVGVMLTLEPKEKSSRSCRCCCPSPAPHR
jgi:hypothetical protein